MRAALVTAFSVAFASAGAAAADELKIQEESPAITIDIAVDARAAEMPAIHDLLKDDAEAIAKEYRDMANADFAERGSDPNWNPYTLDARYEITFANDRVASILLTVSDYTGGAHPNQTFTSFLLNSTSGEEVTTDALFGSYGPDSEAFKAIQAYARDRLAFERAQRLEIPDMPPEDLDWVNEGTETPDTLSTFTLIPAADPTRASGIMLHFPPYQVGSYAEGSYTLEVPALVFADDLAPEYAALFEKG